MHLQVVAVSAAAIGVTAGCASRETSRAPEVTRAWADPKPSTPEQPVRFIDEKPSLAPSASSPIATVNGAPLSRERFFTALLHGHGLALLEQLVVLEAARQLADDRGITVTQNDIDRTFTDAMVHMAGPTVSMQTVEQRREIGEQLLRDFLRKKNISRSAYMLGIERAAYLEKIVAAESDLEEAALRAEFDRQYGEKVQVRHIQLQSLDDVQQVRALLDAGGRFEAVARQHSQNFETGLAGGQLPPFTRDDPDVPQIFAVTAFSLEPGQVSAPIQDGPWYHILKLEQRFPSSDVDFEQVRDQLVESARRRQVQPAVRELAERLFNEARVEVLEPTLRKQYDAKHH
jgi:parvulin-like peptidyl-prolyl isomerase